MLTEYWAHKYYEDPKLKEEVEDTEFNLEEVLQQMQDDEWETVIQMDGTK